MLRSCAASRVAITVHQDQRRAEREAANPLAQAEDLADELEDVYLKKHNLVNAGAADLDVSTLHRFASSALILYFRRLFGFLPALPLVSTSRVLQADTDLYEPDWHTLQLLVDLLKPIEQATAELSAREKPTSCVVLVVLSFLHNRFESTIAQLTADLGTAQPHLRPSIAAVRRVARALKNGLKERLDPLDPDDECNVPFIVATFLHPGLKSFFFLPEALRPRFQATASAALVAEFTENHQHQRPAPVPIAPAPAVPPVAAPAASAARASDLLAEIYATAPAVVPQADAGVAVDNQLAVAIFESELKEYSSINSVPADGDVLLFWRSSSPRIASVKRFAAKYLCISATSVASESLFSTAGMILSDERNRITPERAERLTCIRANRTLALALDHTKRRNRALLPGVLTLDGCGAFFCV